MQEREFHIDPHMTYGDLRRYADSLDVTVSSATLPKGINGIYSEPVRTVLIDRNTSYTQKRCTLVHELVHWSYWDGGCDAQRGSKCESRTRRITAQMLIPFKDAERLGEEYEGELSPIASELNVTVQVLMDYQSLVLPHLLIG
jgi:Zn-dependent peptidase ImmA (M78 family)